MLTAAISRDPSPVTVSRNLLFVSTMLVIAVTGSDDSAAGCQHGNGEFDGRILMGIIAVTIGDILLRQLLHRLPAAPQPAPADDDWEIVERDECTDAMPLPLAEATDEAVVRIDASAGSSAGPAALTIGEVDALITRPAQPGEPGG